MKIKKIEVNNLNGKTFSVNTAESGITLFLAPNGAGKSSLVKALNIALGDKPTDVAPGYAVQLTINEGVKLGVKKTPSKTNYYVNGNAVNQTAYNDIVIKEASEDCGSVSTESIRVTTTSELYNAAESKNIMGYLLPHIAPTLDADRVMAFSPVASDLAEHELRAVLPEMPEKFDLKTLDQAYKDLVAKRKEVNATWKADKARFDALHPTPVTRTLEEVEAAEREFVLAHKDVEVQLEKMRAYNDAVKKAEDIRKSIAVYEAQLKEIDTELDGNVATEENKAQIANYKAKKLKLQTEQTSILATLNKDIELIESTLTNLNKPICPISEKLLCTTDKTVMKKELETSLEENKRSAKNVENTLMDVERDLDKCAEAEKKWERYHKLEESKRTILASMDAFKKNPVIIPEKPACGDDSASYDEALRKFKAEAKNIGDAQEKAQLQKLIEEKEILAKTLDQLVKALDAKGEIKAQCAELCLADINTMLEERTGNIMPGFSICLKAENGITVFAKTPNNRNWTEHKNLSSGEKIAVAVLMMDLINQMVPTNIMIVDNIEQLDRETLEKLRDMVTSPDVSTWYNNVFLLGVDHTDVCEVFSSIEATRIEVSEIKEEMAS